MLIYEEVQLREIVTLMDQSGNAIFLHESEARRLCYVWMEGNEMGVEGRGWDGRGLINFV